MKSRILKELLNNKGSFISGQKLSRNLKVSRTAVWKYINILREEGYKIDSVSNKGYRLVEGPDPIMVDEIKDMLKTEFVGHKIIFMQEVNSTNDYAKQIALNEGEGTIVIAEKQTGGKGRMGRRWVSPPGTGIWMTLVLKPELHPSKVYQITQAIAVAVAEAIWETCRLKAGIKWPNDIIVNGKKICGILTEMSAEPDLVYYIVVGIGINVNTGSEDIPDEIRDKASSLKVELGRDVSRKELLVHVAEHIEEVYKRFVSGGFGAIVYDCNRLSVVLDREVEVIGINCTYRGKALKIREDGVLLVETDHGIEEILSGDVSVRGVEGYV